MVIRCERCSTLYDLDEGLLSPSGSPVQCAKCQHVFTAYPSRAPGRTIVGVPAQPTDGAASPADGVAAAASTPAAPSLPKARSTPAPPHRPSGPAAKPEPKPVRTAPPPIYRPSAPAAGAAPSGVPRSPVLRRDTVGAFEARLRTAARMRWLVPSLAGVAVVVLVAGGVLLSRRGAGAVDRPRQEALALAALDDAGSLDKAIARLEDLERRSPARAATADRALVQVLRAGALADEGETLSARLAARSAERERLRREQPDGWQDAERAAAADLGALEPEVRARQERSHALGAAALESLRRLEAEAGDMPEVVRGLAAYHALHGGRDRVEALHRAGNGSARDPWLDLVSAWADAREQDRAARERALPALKALAASHPEILRGRLLLARTQASLGRRAEAVAALDGVLAANGRHEAARRLRDELTAPIPAPVSAPAPAPAPAAPAMGKPATQPRKAGSQAAPSGGATPPGSGDSAATTLEPASPAVPPSSGASAPAAGPAETPAAAGQSGAGRPGEDGPPPRPTRVPLKAVEPDTVPSLSGG